jgi:tRNA A37 N6-isopentenylltransferase MiaA
VATRQYAKRQMTWFRKEQDVTWLPGFGDGPETVAGALQLLATKLRAWQWEAAERPETSDQV